jgi:hypothetical protein
MVLPFDSGSRRLPSDTIPEPFGGTRAQGSSKDKSGLFAGVREEVSVMGIHNLESDEMTD